MNTPLYQLACEHLDNITRKQFDQTTKRYALINLPTQTHYLERLEAHLVAHHITITENPSLIAGAKNCVKSNYHYTAHFEIIENDETSLYSFHAFFSPTDKFIPLNNVTLTRMQSSNKQTLKLENNEIDDLTNLANRLVSQVISTLKNTTSCNRRKTDSKRS